MIDLKRQEERFKNHIAKLTDYGDIKILDFKDPNTSDYRIRFLFEEDYCKLHISGDLGELTASNYNNMTYNGFQSYINNIGYFTEKINCHSRILYTFNKEKAKKELLELIEEKPIDDILNNILYDFSDECGISQRGLEIASKYIDDFGEDEEYIGEENTGILELYMLAFKLAKEQVEKER